MYFYFGISNWYYRRGFCLGYIVFDELVVQSHIIVTGDNSREHFTMEHRTLRIRFAFVDWLLVVGGRMNNKFIRDNHNWL